LCGGLYFDRNRGGGIDRLVILSVQPSLLFIANPANAQKKVNLTIAAGPLGGDPKGI
jgi:hypothetical protein